MSPLKNTKYSAEKVWQFSLITFDLIENNRLTTPDLRRELLYSMNKFLAGPASVLNNLSSHVRICLFLSDRIYAPFFTYCRTLRSPPLTIFHFCTFGCEYKQNSVFVKHMHRFSCIVLKQILTILLKHRGTVNPTLYCNVLPPHKEETNKLKACSKRSSQATRLAI